MDRIEKLKEFLKDNPGDNFLVHALALEYVKIGKDEKAKQMFEEILEHDPFYTGSYYHLAKLLERNGKTEAAIECYKKGMEYCRQAEDQHAFNELKAAYEMLIF